MRIPFIITTIVISAFITSCKDNSKNTESTSNTANEIITAEVFVKEIDKLGYFKYAEKEFIDSLKQDHIKNFDPKGSWGAIWDWDTFTPLDYRYYLCDGEAVYEFGGFTTMLEELQPTFEKIGFQLTIDDHIEELTEEGYLNHSISINGTNYTIFKNFEGYGWGEAVQRLVEIVNTELEKQQIKERLYPVNGGNDGTLIFLDQPLYDYFYKVFKNPKEKPLQVEEWVKEMNVKPMELQ